MRNRRAIGAMMARGDADDASRTTEGIEMSVETNEETSVERIERSGASCSCGGGGRGRRLTRKGRRWAKMAMERKKRRGRRRMGMRGRGGVEPQRSLTE
jgi:hypothetical protein